MHSAINCYFSTANWQDEAGASGVASEPFRTVKSLCDAAPSTQLEKCSSLSSHLGPGSGLG